MPLTVGGGVSDEPHVRDLLSAGADKVSINSAALDRPDLITECATRLSLGYPLLDPTQPPGGPRSTRWRIVQNVRLQQREPS